MSEKEMTVEEAKALAKIVIGNEEQKARILSKKPRLYERGYGMKSKERIQEHIIECLAIGDIPPSYIIGLQWAFDKSEKQVRQELQRLREEETKPAFADALEWVLSKRDVK